MNACLMPTCVILMLNVTTPLEVWCALVMTDIQEMVLPALVCTYEIYDLCSVEFGWFVRRGRMQN